MTQDIASTQFATGAYIVVPARLGSTRLPRKMLLRETGTSLVHHTWLAARRSKLAAGVCIATDSEEIFREVRGFGGHAEMTSPHCASGTDRVAEVLRRMPPAIDLVVNVQGDEPEISAEAIDTVIRLLRNNPQWNMSTLATPIRSREQLNNPACVKVVFDHSGRALYFSRSPIPHAREWNDTLLTGEPPLFYQHLGIYAYRRQFLLDLAIKPSSRLEQTEKLEQLRVLEAGHSIGVGVVEHAAAGIDTADDYRAFVNRMLAG